jgi:hypothetical protein
MNNLTTFYHVKLEQYLNDFPFHKAATTLDASVGYSFALDTEVRNSQN